VRELRKALGFLSLSVAHHHLKKLREMGLVLRDEGVDISPKRRLMSGY